MIATMMISDKKIFNIAIIMVVLVMGFIITMFVVQQVFGELILPLPDNIHNNHPSTENLPPAFCCKQFESQP